MLLGVGNATIYGISDGPARPAVDALYRLLLVAELRARQACWASRGPELTETAARCAVSVPDNGQRPAPLPDGPVESYTGKAAAGSLASAAGVLAATRDPGRAAEAINATVPKAARLGREGFAANSAVTWLGVAWYPWTGRRCGGWTGYPPSWSTRLS